MKNTIKILAAILATLMLVSFVPLAAFADEIETVAEIEENENTSDTEYEETETLIFEFIEEETSPIHSRVLPPQYEDFDPTDPVPDYVKIVSTDIPDGVYSLQNVGNSDLWMSIEESKPDVGYHVQQYAYSDNPAGTTFERAGLFKISKKSNGLYVIRLMLNNRLSFGFNGNYVITKEIPTVDEEVPDTDCFTITYSIGNYIISPYGSSYIISAPNTTASGDTGAPDSYLTKQTASEAGSRAKWQLFKYNRADRSGSTVYYTSSWKTVGIPVGTTGTMSCKTWTTKIGANTPYKRVAADSSAMISTSYDFTTHKMSFEALSPGKAKIYTMILEGYTEPSVDTAYSYFQIIPQEGTYFIRNSATKKFIDIEGPSTAEGAIIQQWSFSTANQKKWIIEHVSGGEGFVRIKSLYSNKYIAVDSTTNTIIKQTSTLDDYSLWKFERTSLGNLKLVCKALSTTLVLSTPSLTSGSGENLTTLTYTADYNYRDEWQLFENVSFEDIALDVGDVGTSNIQTDCPINKTNVIDYTYTVTQDANYISIDNEGNITALSSGTATVMATHKELNVSYNYEVVVYAGTVTLELYVSDSPGFGHAWINVINNRKSILPVGHYEIPAGSSVTIGKWGGLFSSSGSDFYGIWYNHEHYANRDGDAFTRYISISTAIELYDVLIISEVIFQKYNTYSIDGDHCGHFAVYVWNQLANDNINVVAPDLLYLYILDAYPNDYVKNKPLPCTEEYGYYKDNEYHKFVCNCDEE